MVHALSAAAVAVHSAFSLSVPSPPSARRPSRSHSTSSSSDDRDESAAELGFHQPLLAPQLTPRRVPSAPGASAGSAAPLSRSAWLPSAFRLPSFLSSPQLRPLHRPPVGLFESRGHSLPSSIPQYARLLCQLRLPLYAFLLLSLLSAAIACGVAQLLLRSNSLRLSYQFTSPPHPLTPHYPIDPATLNRTDPAGRLLSPDTLRAHLLAVHQLGSVQLGQLEWMAHQADVCLLVIDLCHPKDERYVRYKVVDGHQRRCLLYRVSSAQGVERMQAEEGEGWRPHLSIVQMADRLPYVLSYTHTLSTVVEYAETHGYAYYIRLVSELERRGRHPSFGRALAAYEIMQLLPALHPHPPPPPALASTLSSHYLFYLDLDAYINTTYFLHIPLTRYILPSVDLHFQGEDTFCAAVFLTRLSSLSLHFFEHVWAQGLLDYTRRHTWEQKAFTHTLNLLLSGHNAFYYSTHCLTDSCEPLYLRSYQDRPDRLWTLSWGAIGFWPLNRRHSLDSPQVHQCVWNRCPRLPGLVVHNGDHSNTDTKWVPDDAKLPQGTCEDNEGGGTQRGRERRKVRGKTWMAEEDGLEEEDGQFRLQRVEAEAQPPAPVNATGREAANLTAAAAADRKRAHTARTEPEET